MDVPCQVVPRDRHVAAVGQQVVLHGFAKLYGGDAEGEAQVLHFLSLLDSKDIPVQLPVESRHVVHLVRAPQEPVEEGAAEHRLQEEELVDGLADDLAQEGVQVRRLPAVHGKRTRRGVERLVARGAEESEFRVEHRSADVDHELLEQPSAVHPALGAAVRGDKLHSEDVAQAVLLGEALEGLEGILYEEVPADAVGRERRLRPRPTRGEPGLLVRQDGAVQQHHSLPEGQHVGYLEQDGLEHLLCTARASRILWGAWVPGGGRLGVGGRGTPRGLRVLLRLPGSLGVLGDAVLALGILPRLARRTGVEVHHRRLPKPEPGLGDDPSVLGLQDGLPPVPVVEEADQGGQATAQGLRGGPQHGLVRPTRHEVICQAVQEAR
mmetsp:Transcript_117648/g.344520  ORF Transcript_117648/g.344520 Transcript_117648/m.344520 type:complete len:380 (+) Transcript_117648:576-1715(+)